MMKCIVFAMFVLMSSTTTCVYACMTDEDCSLNGVCKPVSMHPNTSGAGTCVCAVPWMGSNCALFDRRPVQNRSVAGVYGYSPNVSSWGGNVLLDSATGKHHLYVTEIQGGCGLVAWGSHSAVAHAVSTTGVQGPYIRAGLAVPHQSHNPQAILYKGQWVIFHIFPGAGSPVGPCPAPSPPPPPPFNMCTGMTAVPGYTCVQATCGGDVPDHTTRDCGNYLSLPQINCTIEGKDCATKAAAACAAQPKCESFSLLNSWKTSGDPYKTQLFAGSTTCLRNNSDWSTYVKNSAVVVTPNDVMVSDGGDHFSLARNNNNNNNNNHNNTDTNNDNNNNNTTNNNNNAVLHMYTSASVGGSATTGSSIHVASNPDGPFLPLQTSYPSCNNPSPWVMKNGSIAVLCTWYILMADSLTSPWRHVTNVVIKPATRKNVSANWEDPFLWQDERENFHILSHTYTREGAGPLNSISGHLFSKNLEGPWNVSPTEPYDNNVTYQDGTSQMFSTMERPKLFFNSAGVPTHLTNGVSSVYPCDTCIVGDSPPGGGCCWCKVTPHEDWTFTLMQPLGSSNVN